MVKIDVNLLGIAEEEALCGQYKAYVKDTTTGRCYVIPYGEWTIGRKDDIPLDIPIETDDLYMSRLHAHVILYKNIIGENVLCIRDTKKRTNPTEVDEEEIDNYYDFQLFDGSVFQMGYTDFTVHLSPLD